MKKSKREELLVTSIFSFGHNVSTLSKTNSINLDSFDLSSEKKNQFGMINNLAIC